MIRGRPGPQLTISMEKPTQVVVVGAGPVGLLCAFALASADIQVTIVDAAPEPEIGGRAVAIHPSTLDVSRSVGYSAMLTPFLFSGINHRRCSRRSGQSRH